MPLELIGPKASAQGRMRDPSTSFTQSQSVLDHVMMKGFATL
jgi:hypothetical protein